MRRLRSGEHMVGAGATVLFLTLFFDWFEPEVRPRITETAGQIVGPELHRSGWTSLGWPVVLVLLVVIVLAAWLVLSTAAGAIVSQPVAAAVLTATAGTLALLVLALRVAVFQPGLGVGAPDELVGVELPAYLGLAAVALVAVGGWRSIADERTDAPESAYTPPAARRPPPERA